MQGDYPATVREAVPWLPQFTAAQRTALLGSCDFFALNHCACLCTAPVSGRPVHAHTTGMA